MVGAEQVLKLLDSYWFETTILSNKALSKLDQYSHNKKVVEEGKEEEQVIHIKLIEEVAKAANNTLEFRSFSDQNLGYTASVFSDSPSPNSVLPLQKLRTIPSGTDVREFAVESSRIHENQRTVKRRRFKNRGNFYSSKSLTELEFQELKGFMDLGFVFTEEDRDSRLVSLIPGLQRLGREENEEQNKNDEIALVSNSKPYLSEAWDFYEQKEIRNISLFNWRVPVLGNENDMKHNLKSWAHTVASIVR
ncbi:uncharacterized protein LOC130969477 [Arachis stenosperma]|uniref:uncharacterized protein LOC130969477 n=1 Tax=Arachis stenosperma TaxID=217475 RepID=UPI0025AC1212|nr:uncharacterized protein LOC130969477 [Arachis stenosperma]